MQPHFGCVEHPVEQGVEDQLALELDTWWLQTEVVRSQSLVTKQDKSPASVPESSLEEVCLIDEVGIVDKDGVELVTWIVLHVFVENALAASRSEQRLHWSDNDVSSC